METFKSVSHAMGLGEWGTGIFQVFFFENAKVINMKLGSHNVHHVKNVFGMS